MKLETGMQAPDFYRSLPFGQRRNPIPSQKGKLLLLPSTPAAWTPVCTGQIPSYEALHDTFAKLDVQVLGISTDHVPCLRAWAESLGGNQLPIGQRFLAARRYRRKIRCIQG